MVLLFTDPLYMSFHDEEWGVPVHDDRKLFELLVFSQALAELSWLAILHMRDIFRYAGLHFLCLLVLKKWIS
jgi:3-methyladenine DNA glycosylase Tag